MDDLDQLTPRQQEIAHLAAKGFTNEEIAERVYLEPTTVKHHLTSIYRQMGLGGYRHTGKRVRLAGMVWDQERESSASISANEHPTNTRP